MCRNIRTLYNFEPPATRAEMHDASLQFVRKLTGFREPSQANAAAFERAVDDVARVAQRLFAALQTTARPRNRAVEARRAHARALKRFPRA